MLVAHRAHTRPRRRHRNVTGSVLEDLDVMANQSGSLGEVTRVDMHLSATSLPFREDDLMTQPLQELHRRDSHARKQRVADTGGKQSNAHESPSQSLFA